MNKTSFRGITFAMSLGVEHVLFGNLQSSFHLFAFSGGKSVVLKGSNWLFVDSCI
jgi:DNA-directed RNA polymerase